MTHDIVTRRSLRAGVAGAGLFGAAVAGEEVEQGARLLVHLAGVGLAVVLAARREVGQADGREPGDVVVQQVDVEVVDAGVVGGVGGDGDGVVVGGEAQVDPGRQHAFGGAAAAAEEVRRADREPSAHSPTSVAASSQASTSVAPIDQSSSWGQWATISNLNRWYSGRRWFAAEDVPQQVEGQLRRPGPA